MAALVHTYYEIILKEWKKWKTQAYNFMKYLQPNCWTEILESTHLYQPLRIRLPEKSFKSCFHLVSVKKKKDQICCSQIFYAFEYLSLTTDLWPRQIKTRFSAFSWPWLAVRRAAPPTHPPSLCENLHSIQKGNRGLACRLLLLCSGED